MVAEIARDPETRGLPISGIGGITTWRDAAEFMALGAGNVQVCTAAMTYGFKIVAGDDRRPVELDGREGPRARSTTSSAAPCPTSPTGSTSTSTTSPRRASTRMLCIKCGRCHIACEDTSHQAITSMVDGERHFEVIDDECVGCNLCVNVCPVENCITMEPLAAGVHRRAHRQAGVAGLRQLDARTRTTRWPRWRRSRSAAHRGTD